MTSTDSFFCDTYALIELLNGNPAYLSYANKTLVTSELNLMEFYYSLLRNYGQAAARKYYNLWKPFALKIPEPIIQPAMEFKFHYKKENLSYVDAMGYVFSNQLGARFLTGDQQFQEKSNVEFVR